MTQTRGKWDNHVLSRPGFWIVWRCHVIKCVNFIFFFKTNGKKWPNNENDIHTVMVVFFNTPFSELLDRSYVQSAFSITMRHIDNSILKDTLQLKILRTWIKIRSNTFIKTWVNLMKQKPTKVPGKFEVAEKFASALQRTLHQNRWYFIYFDTLLFLSNKPSF